MRYVKELSTGERQTLLGYRKRHEKSYVRDRSHAILLSEEGKSVPFIADLFKVRTRTVYQWFNRWEAEGISSIVLKAGRGRKAKLKAVNAIGQQLIQTLGPG